MGWKEATGDDTLLAKVERRASTDLKIRVGGDGKYRN
jgi:hypothetical protein